MLVDNASQPNSNPDNLDISSSLAQFISIRVAQFYIHMVQTLRMLESNMDNKRDNKPNSLNQAMKHADWLK